MNPLCDKTHVFDAFPFGAARYFLSCAFATAVVVRRRKALAAGGSASPVVYPYTLACRAVWSRAVWSRTLDSAYIRLKVILRERRRYQLLAAIDEGEGKCLLVAPS